ncbi:hypothetical protein [Streptomyces sp. ISL-99]|uniref:hypothetical protein n=1 Tax=Streptomyces sp. ISL-99 TaxID=2819193 RepID=UPI0027E450E1|nr:hypothetical protein [Streptomyces sp. ISL-99]
MPVTVSAAAANAEKAVLRFRQGIWPAPKKARPGAHWRAVMDAVTAADPSRAAILGTTQ